MFVVCVAANASILNLGFETSEGYPAVYGDSGSTYLYNNGWYCTSIWYVPYIANSTFADTGQRSADGLASKDENRWAYYSAPWTPSTGETMAIYSSAMAFQKYAYGSTNMPSVYGGIALQGMKANSTEAALGGFQLWGNGNVTMWSYPGGTYTSAASFYTFTLNTWYQLQMWADFATNTVQFYVDGNLKGSLSFNSDIVSLSSIALYTGSTASSSLAEVRYDTISLSVPEPMTIAILAFGMLFARARKK